MTPRKHAEVIKAWADGAEIQIKDGADWADIANPSFIESVEYRIKPEAPKWPVTRMSADQLAREYQKRNECEGWVARLTDVANAAIARACEDGDVVPAALKFFFEPMVPAYMLEKVAEAAVEAGRKSVTVGYAYGGGSGAGGASGSSSGAGSGGAAASGAVGGGASGGASGAYYKHNNPVDIAAIIASVKDATQNKENG